MRSRATQSLEKSCQARTRPPRCSPHSLQKQPTVRVSEEAHTATVLKGDGMTPRRSGWFWGGGQSLRDSQCRQSLRPRHRLPVWPGEPWNVGAEATDVMSTGSLASIRGCLARLLLTTNPFSARGGGISCLHPSCWPDPIQTPVSRTDPLDQRHVHPLCCLTPGEALPEWSGLGARVGGPGQWREGAAES